MFFDLDYGLKRLIDRITRNNEVISRLYFDNIVAFSLLTYAFPYHAK